MAATWPATLQQNVNQSGFGLKFGQNKVRTEMDAGPAKARTRFTKRTDEMSVTIWATNDQLADFNAFYDVTLGGGTLPFEFTDPTDEVLKEFRMKGEPDISFVGHNTWNIAMLWERLP